MFLFYYYCFATNRCFATNSQHGPLYGYLLLGIIGREVARAKEQGPRLLRGPISNWEDGKRTQWEDNRHDFYPMGGQK